MVANSTGRDGGGGGEVEAVEAFEPAGVHFLDSAVAAAVLAGVGLGDEQLGEVAAVGEPVAGGGVGGGAGVGADGRQMQQAQLRLAERQLAAEVPGRSHVDATSRLVVPRVAGNAAPPRTRNCGATTECPASARLRRPPSVRRARRLRGRQHHRTSEAIAPRNRRACRCASCFDVHDLTVTVRALDAIEGTPVLDLSPTWSSSLRAGRCASRSVPRAHRRLLGHQVRVGRVPLTDRRAGCTTPRVRDCRRWR